MSCVRNARRLADYIISLPEANQIYTPANQFSYFHIGALFTDVVLQAGLSYESVVKPRVQQILLKYPDENTVTKFQCLIEEKGLSHVINWKHHVKLDRFHRLIAFTKAQHVDSCYDLKAFFSSSQNFDLFLSLNGFGPKSLDYLLKLLNIDTVAVDRHIYSFVKMAKIETKGYQETKKTVEFAADFLNMPRSAIDQLIWNYMSKRQYEEVSTNYSQTSLQFPGFI